MRVRSLKPQGGGWSNLWSLSAQDRWAWFIDKKFTFLEEKPHFVVESYKSEHEAYMTRP